MSRNGFVLYRGTAQNLLQKKIKSGGVLSSVSQTNTPQTLLPGGVTSWQEQVGQIEFL